MDKSACRCSIDWFSHWLYRMTRSYTNRQRKGFLFLHWLMCSFVEGEFKACQSIHERNRQHWNLHTGQTEKEGISSLEESLHDESGLLGDVSKLRCWQYCIGKVFVTIWSDIRMETCLNTEGRGPVDWHPQCPREDWDFVACSAEEHQTPAVWFTSTEETLRHYSTLVLLQSTTHRSRQIFLSSSNKAVQPNRESYKKSKWLHITDQTFNEGITINMRTKTIYDTLVIKRPPLIMNYTILASIYIDIDKHSAAPI